MSSLSLKKRTQLVQMLALVAALLAPVAKADDIEVLPRPRRTPKVQIAILLDNSGSMSGLINQARTQIWKVVNEFRNARRGEERAVLELALYEYGENPTRLASFTRDLDGVSEQLFGLGIRGGEERCGEVIQKATRELEWSGNPDDLKLIYIAGNESFAQGRVNYREAIADASRKGITVNTIHCGGEEPSWRDGARLAGGSFTMINHNAAVAYVQAPQDAEIARLGAELNKTYIGYGSDGKAKLERQDKQDSLNAAMGAGAAVTRSVSKSTSHYDNRGWDLVDAAKSGKAPSAMPAAALPPEMKDMKPQERDEFVAAKGKERAAIQQQIAKLAESREKFLAEERKKGGAAGEKTLDDAVLESVRKEAAKKNLAL